MTTIVNTKEKMISIAYDLFLEITLDKTGNYVTIDEWNEYLADSVSTLLFLSALIDSENKARIMEILEGMNDEITPETSNYSSFDELDDYLREQVMELLTLIKQN